MRRKLLRGIALAAATYLIGVIIIGAILCEGALRRPEAVARLNSPLRDEAPVVIRARDGVELRSVFLQSPSARRGCVVLLHGIGDTHFGMESLGRVLNSDGYSVLLPDSRGHGSSGGALVTYGLQESLDVQTWVDWMEARGCGSAVYGIGESLGGAILLQSLGVERRFRAVIAESAYSSFPEIAVERVAQAIHLTPWLSAAVTRSCVSSGLFYAYLRYGLKLWDVSAVDAVRHSAVPVLLIHGLLDHETPIANSRRIAASHPETVHLWEVPRAGHVGAFGTAPEEFERRALAWFNAPR